MSVKLNPYVPGRLMRITAVCVRNGCDLHALRVPRLMVPVKGLPGLEPWEVMVELELCPAHLAELEPRDYLTPNLRGICRHIFAMAGVTPDFAAAWFDSLHIASEDYRRHQKNIHGDGDANAVRLIDSHRRRA